MTTPELPQILQILNTHKTNALLIAESSLPSAQFVAFRKLFLNEFGEKGLEGELKKLFKQDSGERYGRGGNRLGKKGGYLDG